MSDIQQRRVVSSEQKSRPNKHGVKSTVTSRPKTSTTKATKTNPGNKLKDKEEEYRCVCYMYSGTSDKEPSGRGHKGHTSKSQMFIFPYS